MGRTWIRIFCDKWLEGTLREESLELRGAWTDLLALAGSGRYSNTGEIKMTDNLGLTDDQFASILHAPLDTWLRIKDRLIETARIAADPGTNVVTILNWNVYQTIFDKKAYMRDYMQRRREAKGSPEDMRQPGEEPDPLRTIITRLAQNYEAEIGVITVLISQELADYAQQHVQRNAPIAWIDEAFAEASKNNKRSWAYVRAILTTWLEKGKGGRHGPGTTKATKGSSRQLPDRDTYTDPEVFRKRKLGGVDGVD